jgi:hypothetical protein
MVWLEWDKWATPVNTVMIFPVLQGEELPANLYMEASSLFHAVTWGQNSVVGYY